MTPRFLFILLKFNRAQFHEKRFNSILDQTSQKFELIMLEVKDIEYVEP